MEDPIKCCVCSKNAIFYYAYRYYCREHFESTKKAEQDKLLKKTKKKLWIFRHR